MQTQLITLTSDFGTNDGSVMLMKLAISRVLPNVAYTDFSHSIKPFQISHAAYLVDNLYQQFEEGAIHLLMVNVFANRLDELKAVRYKNHLFVAIDNGIFSYLFKDEKVEIVSFGKLHESQFFYQHIAKSIAELIEIKNTKWANSDSNDYKKLLPHPFKITENSITGWIWFIDDFGNLISNIHRNKIEHLIANKKISINYGYKEQLTKIETHLFNVKPYEPVAYFNQFGYLEIGIRNYNISKIFNLKEGDTIKIIFE
ncbi:MAG: hypothetical protein RJA07_2070 [Bacteroidota bacterium]